MHYLFSLYIYIYIYIYRLLTSIYNYISYTYSSYTITDLRRKDYLFPPPPPHHLRCVSHVKNDHSTEYGYSNIYER